MKAHDAQPSDDASYVRLASPQPENGAIDDQPREELHPLERAGWLSQLTMWWMNDMIRRGYAHPLEERDVHDLPAQDRVAHLQKAFECHYAAAAAAATKASSPLQAAPPPISGAMWNSTKNTMALAIALYFVSAAASLVQPLVIKALLEFLQDAPTSSAGMLGLDSGYSLAALLAATTFVSVSALDFGMFRATRAGIQARTIVVNSVFQKTLQLSSSARRATNSGDIITLVGVDSERLYEAYANGLWALVSPVMVSVVCLLIALTMGWLVGLAAALCAIAILTFAMDNSRRIGQLRRRILQVTGERVQFTSEVLQGIRVVKMYAWDDAVLARVGAIRSREIALLRRYSYMRATNYVVLTMGQTFMTATCLVVYVYQGNTLTVPTTFALLAFTNVCRMPFSVFSNAAIFAHEAWASMGRIAAFLAADEVEISGAQHTEPCKGDEPLVEIQEGEFTWERAPHNDVDVAPERLPTLRGVNLVVPRGSLTVVVGAVGSGKSSLLSALLGEMRRVRGSCVVRGAVAYASQQPWIQHSSVRGNILFGSPFDADRYARVVSACQLQPDLAMLEHGDATEIGERGVNLSGGQKSRVSLARVMYRLAAADLLLLDDPLSALDVHVANAVFHQCVRALARGKTRLLVLNAHYHLLRHADRVVVLADGRVVGDGAHADIVAQFPDLEDHAQAKAAAKAEKEGDQADVCNTDDGYVLHTHETPVEDLAAEAEDQEGMPAKPASMMLAENRVTGAITWRTYAEFLACSGWGSGPALGVALLVAFAVGQCGVVAGDYFLTFWSDGLLRGTIPRETTLLWIFVAITAATTALSIVRAALLTEICIHSSRAMHARYFGKVLRAPLSTFFDVTPVGQVLNRFSHDLDQVDNPLPYYALALHVYAMLTLAILVVCAVATPTTVALYAPLWYACYWLQRRFLAASRELKRLDGVTRSPFLNLVAETINGLESIRAFNMTRHFARTCRALLDHNAKFYFAFQQSTNWFVMRLDWLVTVVAVVVSFTVVAWRGSVGATSAGLALTYAVQLTMNFQRLMTRASATDNFLTSFERLAHYDSLASEGEVVASSTTTPSAALREPAASWPSQGAIEFSGVWLRYRAGLDFVLRGVAFRIRGGEKIGVCGRTGSGKSTLLNALLRTVELSGGAVRIDGVDVATLAVQTLRTRLTIIPQDPVLFSGTLRDNLDPFHTNTDAELFEALRKVRLADDVATWGQGQGHCRGLSFAVLDKGANLSVGQRQLLCIARALLRASKIILVDEATASVDQALDRWIQLAIKHNFRNCTTLTIAHRLETIADCDRILVLEQGHVAEFDAPAALLSKPDGHFASLMASSTAKGG